MDSVLAQSYKNWEHILIDDCSTDSSAKVIRDYADNESRTKLIRLPKNQGAGVARNEGIKSATGRYIAFLDCDDFWHKDKLLKQVQFMVKHHYSVVYAQYYVFSGENYTPLYKVKSPPRVNYRKMLNNDYIGFLTLMYDAKALGKYYMPTIRMRQDWAYKLKLLSRAGAAFGIQEPLAYYRIGNTSLSSSKFRLLKYNFNVYRQELNMSFIKSLFMMANFLVHYFYYKLTSKEKVEP